MPNWSRLFFLGGTAAQIQLRSNRFLHGLSLAGVAATLTVGAIYFPPQASVLLTALAFLTYVHRPLGVTLFLIAAPFDPVRPLLAGIQVSLSELELVVCLLAWAASLLAPGSRRRGPRLDLRPLLWAAPFLAVVLLSGLQNTELHKVGPHLIRRSEPFLALLLASSALGEKRARGFAPWAIAISLIFHCGVGIFQLHDREGIRIASNFNNPNQFAGYLVLVVPLLLALFLASRGKKRILLTYCGLLGLAALLLTFSRSGILAALIAMTTVAVAFWSRPFARPHLSSLRRLLLERPGRNALVLFAHAAVAVVLIASAVRAGESTAFSTRLGRFLQPSYQQFTLAMSFQTRIGVWRAGLEIWADHPFLGVGPNGYARIAPSYAKQLGEEAKAQYRVFLQSRIPRQESRDELMRLFEDRHRRVISTHVHNLPLQVAIEFGALGLAAFLLFVFHLSRELWRRSRISLIALGGLGLMAGVVAQNSFDVTFPSLGLEMGLLTGLALSGQGGRDGQECGAHTGRDLPSEPERLSGPQHQELYGESSG